MPTYDYLCDACGHAFEQWQSFHDAELTTCPRCKKKKLRRLIGTGAAVVFKGSGFYETDYRRDESYKAAAKADQEAPAAKSEPAASTPTETPASTPPTPASNTGSASPKKDKKK
jgi:putative FmdB family regulatory protein